MTNREKYGDEIKKCMDELCLARFLNKQILGMSDVDAYKGGFQEMDFDLYNFMELMLWLDEEYKEPEIDWSKVKTDTPIYVKDNETAYWTPRHFAEYKNGRVYAFPDGKTSWVCKQSPCNLTSWEYAKLAEPM